MTSAVNLSKRTEKIILLIMDEEITLREKKGKDVGQYLKMLGRKWVRTLQQRLKGSILKKRNFKFKMKRTLM